MPLPFATPLTPILSTTVLALLGEHEPEPVLPDLYLVSVAQVDRVHPDAVDVGPVEAPDVAYPVPALLVYDLRVFPRDGDVVQEDAALLPPAHRDNLIAQVMHPAPRRALHLVHLDQSRPFGSSRGCLHFISEAGRVGDRALPDCQVGATLGAELHIWADLGPTLGTNSHLWPLSRGSPSNTLARSSGESAAPPRPTSSARMRSILPRRTSRL